MILVKTQTGMGYASRFNIIADAGMFFLAVTFLDGHTVGVKRFISYGEAERYMEDLHRQMRNITPTILFEEHHIL
jgi:hypothetical protein